MLVETSREALRGNAGADYLALDRACMRIENGRMSTSASLSTSMRRAGALWWRLPLSLVLGAAGGLLLFVVLMAVPVSAVPLGFLAGWSFSRARWGVVAGYAVVVGALLGIAWGHIQQQLEGAIDRRPELTAVAVFTVGAFILAGLAVPIGRIRSRQLRLAGMGLLGLLGIAVLQMATIVLADLAIADPPGRPLLWYWHTMLPYGPWSWETLAEPLGALVGDVLVVYPQLFTLCLTFLLVFAIRTSRTSR